MTVAAAANKSSPLAFRCSPRTLADPGNKYADDNPDNNMEERSGHNPAIRAISKNCGHPRAKLVGNPRTTFKLCNSLRGLRSQRAVRGRHPNVCRRVLHDSFFLMGSAIPERSLRGLSTKSSEGRYEREGELSKASTASIKLRNLRICMA
jgi:hypothetical protein